MVKTISVSLIFYAAWQGLAFVIRQGCMDFVHPCQGGHTPCTPLGGKLKSIKRLPSQNILDPCSNVDESSVQPVLRIATLCCNPFWLVQFLSFNQVRKQYIWLCKHSRLPPSYSSQVIPAYYRLPQIQTFSNFYQKFFWYYPWCT